MEMIDIIKKHLTENGYDGLVNTEIPCGCHLGDLCFCAECFLECSPAYKYHDPRPGKEHQWGMFTQKEPPTAEQFERLEKEA